MRADLLGHPAPPHHRPAVRRRTAPLWADGAATGAETAAGAAWRSITLAAVRAVRGGAWGAGREEQKAPPLPFGGAPGASSPRGRAFVVGHRAASSLCRQHAQSISPNIAACLIHGRAFVVGHRAASSLPAAADARRGDALPGRVVLYPVTANRARRNRARSFTWPSRTLGRRWAYQAPAIPSAARASRAWPRASRSLMRAGRRPFGRPRGQLGPTRTGASWGRQGPSPPPTAHRLPPAAQPLAVAPAPGGCRLPPMCRLAGPGGVVPGDG